MKRIGEAPSPGGLFALGARWIRTLVLAAASFTVNEVPVRAAALTFTSLLAFIPFVIILSFVAGKLGYLHLLSRLLPYLADSFNLDLPLDPILSSIERAQRIRFHRLGLWGSLGLLFSFSISMGNVEAAVNRIWNLRDNRKLFRRLALYTPFLLLLVALIVSSSLLLLKARHGLERWGFHGALPVLRFHGQSLLLGAIGVLVFLWIGLALMIRILPNTRVKTLPAFFGATSATLIIYFLSRLLFLFPSLLLSQNRFLYGSLAIFPVILLLTYVFWAVTLFGAAVAFIHQALDEGGKGVRGEPEIELVPESARPRNLWDEILHELQEIYSGGHP